MERDDNKFRPKFCNITSQTMMYPDNFFKLNLFFVNLE